MGALGRAHVWRQDSRKAAELGAKLLRRGLGPRKAIVCHHLSVARVAAKGSRCHGTPPTMRCWPKAGGFSSLIPADSTGAAGSPSHDGASGRNGIGR